MDPDVPAVRDKVTKAELDALRRGESIDGVYVGRGGRGVPGSVWGNPFHLGKDGSRDDVISSYRTFLGKSGLIDRVSELKGSRLLCHCPKDLACHADVLAELANRGHIDPPLSSSSPPTPSLSTSLPTSSQPMPRRPGVGPARRADFMGSARHYEDGGGLCSPGRWPPKQRILGDFGLDKARQSVREVFIRSAVDEYGKPITPMDFVIRMATGRYKDCPFTEESFSESRRAICDSLGLDPGIIGPLQDRHSTWT